MHRRLKLEDIHDLASKMGGKCLSTEYVNNKTPILWQCNKNHPPWKSTVHSVKGQGTWCPICTRERIGFSIEDAKNLAIEKGGRCLSTEYINVNNPLIWQCSLLHEPWIATLNSIKNNGTWCPKCAIIKRSHSIEFAREIAHSKGGICLSESYQNSKIPLIWQCRYNHPTWLARFDDILNGHWCPKCGYQSYALSIDIANEVAINKGGRCLSTEYVGSMEPLLWQCDKLHTWYSSLNNVKNHNSWCPKCRQSHGEELIALLLKNHFEREYSADKINTSLSGKLRYDFYIPGTKWIIEFDGIQHFEEVTYFTNTKSLLERQQLDRIKTFGAIEAGYSVLRIHYCDMGIINEIIHITDKISEIPSLYVSRDNVYDYLGIKLSVCPLVIQDTKKMQGKYLTLNIIQ